MIEIHRAANRFRSEHDGITTFHCFSAGAHYDPDNVAFGPIVGVDEHLVAPGVGFDWHGHRGVFIVSWLLEGVLRHEDSNGDERFVAPGVLLVQSTGAGIRHRETNPSDTEPLRFVQITILGDADPAVRAAKPPALVGPCTVSVETGQTDFGGQVNVFALVARGEFRNEGVDRMEAGAWLRVDDGDVAIPEGSGELLVVTFER